METGIAICENQNEFNTMLCQSNFNWAKFKLIAVKSRSFKDYFIEWEYDLHSEGAQIKTTGRYATKEELDKLILMYGL